MSRGATVADSTVYTSACLSLAPVDPPALLPPPTAPPLALLRVHSLAKMPPSTAITISETGNIIIGMAVTLLTGGRNHRREELKLGDERSPRPVVFLLLMPFFE